MSERKIDDTQLENLSGGAGVKEGPGSKTGPTNPGSHDSDTAAGNTGGEFGQ